jgi:hypothetical protein
METYSFEIVKEFAYLGTLLTARNELNLETKKRINAANRAYHTLLPLLKSQLIQEVLRKLFIRP